MNPSPAIAEPPVGIRLHAPRGLEAGPKAVDHKGGRFEAGLIKGFSVITRGEALGHGLWIDGEFLDQVVESMAEMKKGLRSRFTHPGISSDAMGKQIGRAFDGRRASDKVLGDLHIQKTARKREDYGGQVLDWAQEDPEAFGASIVFQLDSKAMKEFRLANSDDDETFVSPDEDNTKNLPHARLKEIEAVDVVGDPAANPDGLFTRGNELPLEVERALDYALGLSDIPPDGAVLGVHPDRMKTFLNGYLARRGLSVASCDLPGTGAAAQADESATEGDRAMAGELKSITLEQLEAERPDLVGQLKAAGAEEEAEKGRNEALEQGRKEGQEAERKRQQEIMAFAATRKLNADDETVKRLLADNVDVESAERVILERRLDVLEEESLRSPGGSPPPEAPSGEAASAYKPGMTVDQAWDANAKLPQIGRVQSEWSTKESFAAWAANTKEGKALFAA